MLKAARLLVASGALALGGLAAAPAVQPLSPEAAVCPRPELTTTFGMWFAPDIDLDAGNRDTPGGVVPPQAPGETPITSVRLLLEARPAPAARWRLLLRDMAGRVLLILTPADFAGTGPLPKQRWTSRLEVAQVTADLDGADPGEHVRIRAGIAAPTQSKESRLFSTKSSIPNWRELYGQSALTPRRVGESVGMLVTSADSLVGEGAAEHSERTPWCCTGVMIAPDLFLTNWHCGGRGRTPDLAYWNSEVAANAVVDLGWDGGPVRRQYTVVGVAYRNRDLDYTVLRLEPTIGAGAAVGPATAAAFSFAAPAPGDPLFIIHHAQCQAKLVSIGCHVQGVAPPWTGPAAGRQELTHDCDTEPGASGAPIFDASGHVLALHHLGFNQGGQCAMPDHVNKAVLMNDIARDLRDHAPQVWSRLGWPQPH